MLSVLVRLCFVALVACNPRMWGVLPSPQMTGYLVYEVDVDKATFIGDPIVNATTSSYALILNGGKAFVANDVLYFFAMDTLRPPPESADSVLIGVDLRARKQILATPMPFVGTFMAVESSATLLLGGRPMNLSSSANTANRQFNKTLTAAAVGDSFGVYEVGRYSVAAKSYVRIASLPSSALQCIQCGSFSTFNQKSHSIVIYATTDCNLPSKHASYYVIDVQSGGMKRFKVTENGEPSPNSVLGMYTSDVSGHSYAILSNETDSTELLPLSIARFNLQSGARTVISQWPSKYNDIQFDVCASATLFNGDVVAQMNLGAGGAPALVRFGADSGELRGGRAWTSPIIQVSYLATSQ